MRFKTTRCHTTSGRSKVWLTVDTLGIFPNIKFSNGANERNRAMAERLSDVLNAGAWRDDVHLLRGKNGERVAGVMPA